jgi:hypothetical protein
MAIDGAVSKLSYIRAHKVLSMRHRKSRELTLCKSALNRIASYKPFEGQTMDVIYNVRGIAGDALFAIYKNERRERYGN